MCTQRNHLKETAPGSSFYDRLSLNAGQNFVRIVVIMLHSKLDVVRHIQYASYLSLHVYSRVCKYKGCSNMNASSFITFVTYVLQPNGIRFHKGLYVTFQLAPDLKQNTVYLSSYRPLNEGHVSILTN